MPPIVMAYMIGSAPVVRQLGAPANAVFQPALHDQHMGNRMCPPGVGRVEIDRLAPAAFGLGVVTRFLKVESAG